MNTERDPELGRSELAKAAVMRLSPLARLTDEQLKQWRPMPGSRAAKSFDVDIDHLLYMLTGHDLSMALAPYETLEPTIEQGGHVPETQLVLANPNGALQISTRILERSSHTFSKAELQVKIKPMFGAPWSRLSFRPWVTYFAQRYLDAAGETNGSHSDVWIRSTVISTDADGGDGQWEADSRGLRLWDDRVSAFWGAKLGHDFDTSFEADFEGTAPWQDLEVKVDMHHDRVYYGRVRIESHADGDGIHTVYGSRAKVFLIANVKWNWVEQSGSQYHG